MNKKSRAIRASYKYGNCELEDERLKYFPMGKNDLRRFKNELCTCKTIFAGA
jgi:hypothetical protein